MKNSFINFYVLLALGLATAVFYSCKPNDTPDDPTTSGTVKTISVNSIQALLDSVNNYTDSIKFVLSGEIGIMNDNFVNIQVLRSILNEKPYIELNATLAKFYAAEDSVNYNTERQDLLESTFTGSKLIVLNNGYFYTSRANNPNDVLNRNPELTMLRTDTLYATNSYIYRIISEVLVLDKNTLWSDINYSENRGLRIHSVESQTNINKVFYMGGINNYLLEQIVVGNVKVDDYFAIGEYIPTGLENIPPRIQNSTTKRTPLGLDILLFRPGSPEFRLLDFLLRNMYVNRPNPEDTNSALTFTVKQGLPNQVTYEFDPQFFSINNKDVSYVIIVYNTINALRDKTGYARGDSPAKISGTSNYLYPADITTINNIVNSTGMTYEEALYAFLSAMYSQYANATTIDGIYNAFNGSSGGGTPYHSGPDSDYLPPDLIPKL